VLSCVCGFKYENQQNNITEHVELSDSCIIEGLSSLYKNLNFPTKLLYYPDRTTTVAHKIMNQNGDVCEAFNKFARSLQPFSQWL